MYIDRVRGAQLISMRILEYRRVVVSVCAVTAAVTAIAQAPTAGAPATHGGEHQHLDSRFGHNRYYYDRGYAVHSPPDGGLANLHGPDGQRYYFHGADWYRWKGSWDQSWHWQRWWHGGWVVSAAPAGVFVPLLPPAYTMVWWGRTPYYYANDTYYVWDAARNEYQVVAPPPGLEAAGTTPAPVTPGASDQLFADPTKGQPPDQQARDRTECNQWSVSESGYDPTAPNAAAQSHDKRDAYFRAQAACLDARGYAVK
ncbi:MAG: hypothetical protein JO203_00080 [Gammaproteobacteria bacterium]|nr:hypothetical protein [Gammaproteobacteria bacterium]